MTKIIVYGTKTCLYCDMVKDFLKGEKVDFEYIDVGEDQEKGKEMVNKSGQMGVPVLDIDGEIIVGFNKPKIEEVLKERGILK